MVPDKLALTIKKTSNSDDQGEELVYDSLERGKVVDVTVTDIDGTPYDLTGLVIKFIDVKRDSKLVVDSETSLFNRPYDSSGRFSYTFPDQVYASSGWAKFEFWKSNKKIDTTCDFHIEINQYDDDLLPDDSDYISALDKLQDQFQSIINSSQEQSEKAQQELAEEVKSAKAQIDQLISSAKKALDDVVGESDMTAKDYAELKKKLAALQDLADKLDKDSTIFDDIQKQIDSLKRTVIELQKDSLIKRFDDQESAEKYMAENSQGIVVVNEGEN